MADQLPRLLGRRDDSELLNRQLRRHSPLMVRRDDRERERARLERETELAQPLA